MSQSSVGDFCDVESSTTLVIRSLEHISVFSHLENVGVDLLDLVSALEVDNLHEADGHGDVVEPPTRVQAGLNDVRLGDGVRARQVVNVLTADTITGQATQVKQRQGLAMLCAAADRGHIMTAVIWLVVFIMNHITNHLSAKTIMTDKRINCI